MDNYKIKIIVPTSSQYQDVCICFLQLLHRNWPNCPYEIVISVTGESVTFGKTKTIYNGPSATLPDCIRNAAEILQADGYLIFLGDAFITCKIRPYTIENFVTEMVDDKIQYCNLAPQKNWMYNKYNRKHTIRYICSTERYTHSFTCFYATDSFIKEEFKESITDMDFEMKYLEIAETGNTFYYDDHAILKNNIFNITLGIEKGKWDRRALYCLQKENPDISFPKRHCVSMKHQCFLELRKIVLPILPNSVRKNIKKLIRKRMANYMVTQD